MRKYNRQDFLSEEMRMNFTAPEVSVLIVDDNEINLEVTAGLLEPLQMKIDMADSGKRALQMAQKTRYNLISWII